MDASPGTYAVILRNENSKTIAVGVRRQLAIEPGYYLYLGSAFGPGGIRARVGRHSRRDKPRRWHIDYVREHMVFHDAWYSTKARNQEHQWAKLLKNRADFIALAGIGCSDCQCQTHLYFSRSAPDFDRLAPVLDQALERWPVSASADTVGRDPAFQTAPERSPGAR